MAVPKLLIMTQDNTQSVKLFGVQDEETQLFWNSAVIAATLLDSFGVQVPGCVAVNLVYVTASNGDYRGPVSAVFSPPVGGGYTLVVDGDQGGSHLHLEIPVEVRPRTS